MDLPEPVSPTSATSEPRGTSKQASWTTSGPSGEKRKSTWSKTMRSSKVFFATGCAGSGRLVSVSRIEKMRTSAAAPRWSQALIWAISLRGLYER